MLFIMATNNQKKRAEMARILEKLNVEVITAEQAGIDLGEIPETGSTFEENAELKALAAMNLSGLAAIADDSGLMVDALNGEPGIYSARYGGPGTTDRKNLLKLLENLKDVPAEKRTARFVSAICCLFPDGRKILVRGECEGKIGFEPKGEGGFGYDPIFVVENSKTFSELTPEEKDGVSHRGAALRKLQAALSEALKGEITC